LFVSDKTKLRNATALNRHQCFINGVIRRRWRWLELKQAAKRAIVGADSIYQNLRRFFPRGRSTPPPAPAPNP
jgi:hypothetical protein